MSSIPVPLDQVARPGSGPCAYRCAFLTVYQCACSRACETPDDGPFGSAVMASSAMATLSGKARAVERTE